MRFFSTSSNHPTFWLDYANLFKQKKSKNFEELVFVVLDTETTGFDKFQDRILSIGALKIQNNIIQVHEVLDIYIQQEKFNKETVAVHGILKNSKRKRVEETVAIQQFLEYVGDAIIVAHHASFDIGMINMALKRMGLPKLKNIVLDTGTLYKKTLIKSYLVQPQQHYTLDDLADKFAISKKDRHTALGDAYITAVAFLKLLTKIKEKKELTLKNLR